MNAPHLYAHLTPEIILDAVEAFGVRCTGGLSALNSYENRVYQVSIEDSSPLIAKFYRPDRWSDAAILEEHQFTRALAARELPVIAPLADSRGRTLLYFQGFRVALYPRHGGRPPHLEDPNVLQWIGRLLGRIHALGATRRFVYRPTLDIDGYAGKARRFVLGKHFVPAHLAAEYEQLSHAVLVQTARVFEQTGPLAYIRVHGDFHPGNLLWTEAGPHLVDFDDCRMAPAIQDLWMLLSGDHMDAAAQLREILEGYEEFHPMPRRQLLLVEALRSLRIIHYTGWLARRWHDPAFPKAFPWFNDTKYWEQQIETLREQRERLEKPPSP